MESVPRGNEGGGRRLLGQCLALVVRLLLFTLRVRVIGTPPGNAGVFAFWHGKQFGLLRVPRPRPTQVLVSWSRDGELQAGLMRSFGLEVVRGSSSRGGGVALRQLLRRLPSADVALAVDGPRGPRRRAKAGAVALSRLGAAPVIPLGIVYGRSVVFHRAWDRFELPLPFSRVCVVFGAATRPAGAAQLTQDLLDVEGRAERALEAWRGRSPRLRGASHPLLMRRP